VMWSPHHSKRDLSAGRRGGGEIKTNFGRPKLRRKTIALLSVIENYNNYKRIAFNFGQVLFLEYVLVTIGLVRRALFEWQCSGSWGTHEGCEAEFSKFISCLITFTSQTRTQTRVYMETLNEIKQNTFIYNHAIMWSELSQPINYKHKPIYWHYGLSTVLPQP
jgi:hypothetical protein